MEIPDSARRVTLRDIAKVIGITHGAVSLALRNSPKIAVATRERVQALAQEMGYQQNSMAAGLANFKRTSTIKPVQAALAWLNLWPKPEQLRSFREFNGYWQGASQAAGKFGYRLEEFVVGKEMTLHRVEKILRTRNIRGILVPPPPILIDWAQFDWEQFSTVRFGRATAGIPQFHMVSSAQSANSALAVTKMKERGYERIGYVGWKTERWTYLGGFLQAQLLHIPAGMRLPPMLLEDDDQLLFNQGKWTETSKRLISWLDDWKPDAILTEAAEVLQLLDKAGRHGADRPGLAGLNVLDLPYDSGIQQYPEEIGRVATLVALSLINDNACGIPPIPREILVKGSWVDGSSLPPRT